MSVVKREWETKTSLKSEKGKQGLGKESFVIILIRGFGLIILITFIETC